jgi:hypothetical protein
MFVSRIYIFKMKKLFTVILTICIFYNCRGQGNFGYAKGLIIKKQGDALRCWIERAVGYDRDFYYKTDSAGKPQTMWTEDVESIILPYTIVKSVKTGKGKKEMLLNLMEEGKLRLFTYVD